MRSPKRIASAPSRVNRIIRVAPTTASRRLREYCSAAAAITNAVNGNGGGASDAIVSATPASWPIFLRTRSNLRFDRCFSNPLAPSGRKREVDQQAAQHGTDSGHGRIVDHVWKPGVSRSHCDYEQIVAPWSDQEGGIEDAEHEQSDSTEFHD